MYTARLRHGHSIQVLVPGKVCRSREGSIHLQIDSPTVITDDEANFLKREIEHGSLKDYSIILEPVPRPVALPSLSVEGPAPFSPLSVEAVAVVAPAPDPVVEPVIQAVNQDAEVVVNPGTITEEKDHEPRKVRGQQWSKRRKI